MFINQFGVLMKKVLQLASVITLLLLLGNTVALAQNGTVGNTKPTNNTSKFWSKVTKSQESNITNVAPVNDFVQVPQIIRNIQLNKSIAVVYPNFRPFPSTTTQSELSVDVSPTDEKIIFCSANTYVIGGALYGTGIYFTTNQGSNWTGYDNPPFGTNSGDPASVISLNGYFYEGYITNASGQGVSRSTDNGATWTSSVVGTVPGSSDLLDKNHMTADKSPSSPYKNRVYVAYTEFISGSANENQIVVKYSSDNGTTWSAGVNVSTGANAGSHNQGVNLSTGPNGEVYAIWAVYDNWAVGSYGEDGIGFNVSTDGGATWGTAKRIYTAANFGIRGNLTSKNSIRVSSFPSMAVDRSGGPRNGYIYCAWAQVGVAPAGTDPDIVTIRSTNGGATWTTPVRVNDDAVSNGKDQYYNWITVDQATGAVYHLFYDSRNVANSQAEVYCARSIDGNLTFENIKVSDHSFTPNSISGLASGYQGDYIGIAAFRNFVYPYWMDNSSGIYQGWMCKMTFGPRIEHTALGNTENLTGPYPVRISVLSSSGIAANSVKLFWKRGSGAFADSILMVKDTGNTWIGNIPGNGTSATYSYYVQATDTLNGTTKLPASAPSTYFSFTAGADLIAPAITHTVLPNQYRELWPATVSATITDNLGIDSAWVVYKVKSTGTQKTFKILKTADSTYQGVFNNDTTGIAIGDTLFYRIVARDISAAHNLGYNPSATGFNSFVFIGDVINPVITHTPLLNQGIKRWPATVKATVTDNLGIQSVVCNFKINNGINRSFPLLLTSNNEYSGAFNVDTNTVHVGDTISYSIQAIDRSTNHNVTLSPATGYYRFTIVATNGMVLVVNDETSLKDRISTNKPYVPFEDKEALGASATMFKTVLTADNYMVDTTTFANLDVTKLANYDMVILSAGLNTGTMFDNATKRTAIVNYTLNGGKVLVEGGEVGYIYRKATSDLDINFRQNVLHDSSWSTDGPYSIKQNSAYSSFFNNPNLVPDSLAIVSTGSYGRMDIMTLLNAPGVVKLATGLGYSNQTAACLNGYFPPASPSNLRNIVFHFAVSGIVNTTAAANLIMNAAFALRGAVTPVEMTTFTASTSECAVNLLWNTATEVNNSGFSVERKSSNSQFTTVGFIPGRGTTTTPSAYSFVDKNVPAGKYIYRLKQVDFNGETHYSKEVEVNVTTPKVFSLQQNYPNPFNPTTTIKYSVPVDGFVNLAIYNVLGQKVANLVSDNVKAGSYEVKFNAANLASGIYIYKIEAGNFNATKKMMLIK